ncbi:MAG TPA: threonine/serine exporter family protein [Solirubrobacteraceae bacterium]|nr:threonine/serine exporter family protein [Solirubrobacteraceae bacterium]
MQLGVALLATGDAVSDIEHRLLQAAKAYGQPDARVMVLPTAVLVAGDGGAATLATHDGMSSTELRLDQVTAVLNLAAAAGKGELSPAEGRRRLGQVHTMPNRHTPLVAALGYVIVTLGVGLVIRPSVELLPLYLALGSLVALLRAGAARVVGMRSILPVIAAAAVSAIAFKVYPAAPLQAVIPALVVFLPGGLLTMATVDLASDEVVTGSTRFVAGLLQLALLAVGIVLGARLVGVVPSSHSPTAAHLLGWWAPWLGVLVFGLGTGLEESAPLRSLPWLLLVLYTAWAGQLLGAAVLGPLLSGFVGGLVVAPLATLIERFPSAPPALVSFLPAFWMLVPGSLGLIGVTQLVGDSTAAGATTFTNALVSVVAIALGILVGLRALNLIKEAGDTARAHL